MLDVHETHKTGGREHFFDHYTAQSPAGEGGWGLFMRRLDQSAKANQFADVVG